MLYVMTMINILTLLRILFSKRCYGKFKKVHGVAQYLLAGYAVMNIIYPMSADGSYPTALDIIVQTTICVSVLLCRGDLTHFSIHRGDCNEIK